MARGAPRKDVLRAVLRQRLRLATTGLLEGRGAYRLSDVDAIPDFPALRGEACRLDDDGRQKAFGTYLLLNFSGIDEGVLLFQQGLFSGNHYYCDASEPGVCLFPGETVVPISVMVGYQKANLRELW